MSQLTEAEVVGDISCVRSHSNELNSLTVFPRKVLIFREDFRPGYFGTWTRNSATIGPRCPFAKDLAVFDYGYDSAEEWEEEGEADDVVDDGEEEDGEIDDPDSDLDSWLVDDDDDVQPPSHESSPPLSLPEFHVSPPPKRKSDGEERKLGKKRKVVVPLLPFAKGPCWETPVTWCENDLFRPYQIRLFNGQL
jgi:chromatin assembly factor 1 subunit A